MRLLITGGCGFIGSNFVRYWREHYPKDEVVVLDAHTYAGRTGNLDGLDVLVAEGDVCDKDCVESILSEFRIDAVLHLAAETHVDRSIYGPGGFLRTNVIGAQVVLDAAVAAGVKRFLHVSTDEVCGDRPLGLPPANESSPLHPSSPYAASKAAGELLALAYHRTHGLPVVVARPTNTYGPRQYPEKLIPLAVLRAIAGIPVPVYGDGRQIREWIHVDDVCRALDSLLRDGWNGEVYNVGGFSVENQAIVAEILRVVEEQTGRQSAGFEWISDRPGHDRRYAVNSGKIWRTVGFSPRRRPFGILAQEFDGEGGGIAETARWYIENESWWRPIVESVDYKRWVEKNYGEREARSAAARDRQIEEDAAAGRLDSLADDALIDDLYKQLRDAVEKPPVDQVQYQDLLKRLQTLEVAAAQRLRQRLAASGPLKPGSLDDALREAREILARFAEKAR